MEAQLQSSAGDKVTMKMKNGRVFTIPLADLAAADQRVVEQLLSPPPATAPTPVVTPEPTRPNPEVSPVPVVPTPIPDAPQEQLPERSQPPAAPTETHRLNGVTLRELTDGEKKYHETESGAVVVSVHGDSLANGILAKGHVIVEISYSSVASPEEAEAASRAAAPDRPMVMTVLFPDGLRYVTFQAMTR